MPLWIFRASALLGIPFLVYVFLAKDLYSVLLAFLCGVVIVCAETFLRSFRFSAVMIAIFGGLCGYLIYLACDYVVLKLNVPDILEGWASYKTIFAGVFVLIGSFLSIIKSSELEGISKKGRHLKVTDISALIDGRIIDVCETGFLSGTIVIPQFVIAKLSELASSKDLLEKARGRRGLDIVSRLKELKNIPVKITSKSFKSTSLQENVVLLAKSLSAEIVTIDFNINKIAILKNVNVLNISDLTTALKPVVLPGETMALFVMKEGKEKEQGIAYLDDGTMVVVEDGKRFIGKRAEVSVYSILQNSTGRMIFARIKQQED
ncbi:MAG: TRAM domain-containing protein [Elusimicrobiaceae bacterium]|nr:TRAM domain-containing protein [Elusimicrobiaceae bacterium]